MGFQQFERVLAAQLDVIFPGFYYFTSHVCLVFTQNRKENKKKTCQSKTRDDQSEIESDYLEGL